MDLQLYRLKFYRALFGEGSLLEVEPLFTANRLFSALFIEAQKLNLDQDLMVLASKGNLQISNAMFYLDPDQLFLPKPIGYPKRSHHSSDDAVEDRQNAKALKKLSAIRFDDFDEFVAGEIEIISDLLEEEKPLYQTDYVTRKGEDPYRVYYTSYQAELAVIMAKDPLIEELMHHLQYSGLGGKRSSGYGRFELTVGALSQEIADRIVVESQEPVMLLNNALPRPEEMNQALEEGHYLVKRSGGYAYSKQTDFYRKQDFYSLKAGSTFKKTFKGKIFDVAPDDIDHPVYHYAQPLFFRLEG